MVRGESIPVALLLILGIQQSGLSQIVPDQTLGQERSILTSDGQLSLMVYLNNATLDDNGAEMGGIVITTDEIVLQNGVSLNASTSGTGDGGIITLNTQTLTLSEGSNITTHQPCAAR